MTELKNNRDEQIEKFTNLISKLEDNGNKLEKQLQKREEQLKNGNSHIDKLNAVWCLRSFSIKYYKHAFLISANSRFTKIVESKGNQVGRINETIFGDKGNYQYDYQSG